MATRFVELNEAATILGLTPEQLVEMRSNGEIHGYRDGASWKFKIEEVERVKAERSGSSAEGEESSSVLVNEEASKGDMAPSKVIGTPPEVSDAESDLKLAGDSDMSIASDSGFSLGGEGGKAKKGSSSVDSDVALVPGVAGDSDVKLVADTGSDKTLKAPPSADVLSDSQIKLKSGSSGGTGDLPGAGSSRAMGSGLGSGDLDIALDSELALSEDDEMVLGGSGAGSDLTLNPAADSGINLSSPSDSGLSLEADSGISLQSPTDSGLSLEEEPVDMGGSSISELELPEDEAVELDHAEPAQNLKKDEEFLLSPSDEMFTDESDSGSQVIALEDSAAFDQDAMAGQAGLLPDAGLDQQLDSLGGGAAAATPMMAPAFVGAGGVPEAPYSAWNIAGLAFIFLLLSITGILMTDIMRNMWAWEDGLDLSTSISVGISKAFGMD
jgi:hypothetical protein